MMNRGCLAASVGIAALLAVAATAFADSDAETIAAGNKAPYGAYLTADDGHAVYMFTGDHDNGTSACQDACAKAWPPVTTGAAPVAGPGIQAGLLGTLKRGDAMQVTYDGKPLYYFVGDKSAGTTAGENITHFGGSWYLVSPGGKGIGPTGAAEGNGSW